jgi:hypothetical protein
MLPFMIVISIRKGSRKKGQINMYVFIPQSFFSHRTALNGLETRRKNIQMIKKIFSHFLSLSLSEESENFLSN